MGKSVWIYDGSSTAEIGLTDDESTRSDGYRVNTRFSLAESGMVGGHAERYMSDGSLAGQDAWIYDPLSNRTVALRLSARSDGYAFSQLVYVGDDGLVLGAYRNFDGEDNDLGQRAFYFTLSEGIHDLGSLVNGGLETHSMDSLVTLGHANDSGQIFGSGKLSGFAGQTAYLLTPVIPEPSCLVFSYIGAALFYLKSARSVALRQLCSAGSVLRTYA
jgi:hypothetical protein